MVCIYNKQLDFIANSNFFGECLNFLPLNWLQTSALVVFDLIIATEPQNKLSTKSTGPMLVLRWARKIDSKLDSLPA